MPVTGRNIDPPSGELTLWYTDGQFVPTFYNWQYEMTNCHDGLLSKLDDGKDSLTKARPKRSEKLLVERSHLTGDLNVQRFAGAYACAVFSYTERVQPVDVNILFPDTEGFAEERFTNDWDESYTVRLNAHYRGSNPSHTELSQALGSDVLRAICWHESSWRQFDSGNIPLKNINTNGTTDWGCMQINQATPLQIWNWRENVSAGTSLYGQKQQAAQSYLSAHPPFSPDMLLRETIQRYNGGVYYTWNSASLSWDARPPGGYVQTVLDLMASKPWNQLVDDV